VLSGTDHYFRQRIRYALFDKAEVEPTDIEIDGHKVAARRVSLRPFLDDPNADRMGAYTQKLYEFTLTPEVPGGLYSIHTLVPGEDGGAPLMEDELTFREASR
jgi:hypothetical protein